MAQAIITFFFFFCKTTYCNDCENASDSGISESWRSSNITEDFDEHSPLIISAAESNYRIYTEEKVQYYEQSRREENERGDANLNELTDVRGTVAITGKGSCEV